MCGIEIEKFIIQYELDVFNKMLNGIDKIGGRKIGRRYVIL